MRCRAYIDAKHNQQSRKSLRESRQDSRDRNNVCAGAKRKREDIGCLSTYQR